MARDEKRRLDRSIEIGRCFLSCVRMGELLHRADDGRHLPATLNHPLNHARYFSQKEPQISGPIPIRRLPVARKCRDYLVECRSEKMRAVADVLNGGIDIIRNPGGQPTHCFQFLCQTKFNFSLLTKACLLVQLGNGRCQTLGSNSKSLFESGQSVTQLLIAARILGCRLPQRTRNVAFRLHLPDDALQTSVGQMLLDDLRIRCPMFDSNDMKLGAHTMRSTANMRIRRAATARPRLRIDGAPPPRLLHPHPTLVSPQRTRSLRDGQEKAAWKYGYARSMQFRHEAYCRWPCARRLGASCADLYRPAVYSAASPQRIKFALALTQVGACRGEAGLTFGQFRDI